MKIPYAVGENPCRHAVGQQQAYRAQFDDQFVIFWANRCTWSQGACCAWAERSVAAWAPWPPQHATASIRRWKPPCLAF